MSKITFYAALFSSIAILSSCGGGWSEEQKDQIKNTCIGNGNYDCDCYVEKITSAHPDPDTYNSLSKEDKNSLVEDCLQEVEESEEEEMESF